MRYSLRRWIATVVLTGALFGVTFNMYSGGFTPSRSYAAARRGDVPAGQTCWGDVNQWGWPFSTRERFDSYIDSVDDFDGTYRRVFEVRHVNIGLNLLFWFGVALGLTGFVSRRLREKVE